MQKEQRVRMLRDTGLNQKNPRDMSQFIRGIRDPYPPIVGPIELSRDSTYFNHNMQQNLNIFTMRCYYLHLCKAK